MKRELDFSVVSKAKLTQLEFAALCGVSRVTANLWIAGKMHPHQYIQTRVSTLLTALHKAVERELLPLPRPHAKDQRIELTKAALRAAAAASAGRSIVITKATLHREAVATATPEAAT